MLAAFALSLVLGAGFLLLTDPPANDTGTLSGAAPMSDDEAESQVVDSARDIVERAGLSQVSGSVVFLSCTNLHDPPYQAAVYLNFALPETNSVKRIREVAEALVAAGWQEAPAMGEHFGMKLTRGGVTATFHENQDDPRFAEMRIYGQCRVTSDHRDDNPAFTDVTDRLR
jgi:hypothetical protein